MSTTTTLEVTLQSHFEVVTLVVKKSDVEVVKLPDRLYDDWRAIFEKRSTQPVTDQRIAEGLKHIEVHSTSPGSKKVRSLEVGSDITFILGPNHHFEAHHIWRDRVASISAKVSF